ncbi:IS66 family insertion sequence element accessory protein TnpA [Polyangium sorediatum]|uniref:IS66 family insertion sequence element accessory protein TnpB n=1 Tax=Polyangium sorediatum TaxID=889274 RepID=A0ABT6P3E3_9BACT|nr:IS66 family insertion sequence element accessory protein TnpB [Polyangium sorediatum]MDI1435120.1 IS66 family insertion sequence element accessory protein TnpB [Polyangium sorediatum]
MARRTAKQWARLVARWKRSGLRAGEFGAKVGVDAHSLHWWSWSLRKREAIEDAPTAPTESVPAFLPVHLVEAVLPREQAAPLARGGVEIVVDERHAVRVSPGFDEETLLRVLGLLRDSEPR